MSDQFETSKNLWITGFSVVVMLVGVLMALPGLWLIALGGSWYYTLVGAVVCYAGFQMFQGNHNGLYTYFVACGLTVLWALYEVWPMQSWFWPLIPRVFAFAFALFFLLLVAPQFSAFKHNQSVTGRLRLGAGIVGLGLVLTLWAMFYPHGVIQNKYVANLEAKPLVATEKIGQEWRNYGRTTMGTRFVPAQQITKDNINKLEVAWSYRTEVFGDHDNADQNTPVFANNTVFSCTHNNQVHAIDGETGKRKWLFDPKAKAPFFERCRGVTYYEPSIAGDQNGACAKRIVLNTVDARLISLDAETGKRCAGFGNQGEVNLMDRMGDFEPGYYFQTSAPTVTKDMIILGGMAVDNNTVGEPSGVIRAFNAMTGEFRWAWDIGRPGENGLPPKGETFTKGTPNVWTHPAVDEALGLIYLPTGNATPDVANAHRRPFDGKYNSSIVALDIETGKERWKFQTVYNDVWDYDLPSQPSLYDVTDPKTGKLVPALIQPTKRGQIFMLNRVTGKPIADVVEKKVRVDGLAPGFKPLSDVQPYSVGMPNIGGERLYERDMWGATPIDQLFCRIKFRSARYTGNEFPPPSLEPFFTYPGAQGGMNWGAGSVDENRGIFVINDLRLPIITTIIPRDKAPKFDKVAGPHDPIAPQKGTPYALKREAPTSILGLLCSGPPYGTITAIDLKTRSVLWQRPVGTIEDLDFIGIHTGLRIPLGMPTLGGSVITGSGLVFFPNAMDRYIRAFDVETGNQIWRKKMPVGADATPISYVAKNGKQYIVVSAGGSTYATKENRGDYVIAYALPDGK